MCRCRLAYLRSRHRIAVGQRFYLLEPLGEAPPVSLSPSAIQREQAQSAPSQARARIKLRRGRASISIYLSESDAQAAAEAIRQGRGGLGLVQTAARLLKAANRVGDGRVSMIREGREGAQDLASGFAKTLPAGVTSGLQRRLQAWVLPTLAQWVRSNAEAFVRAAAHPTPGVLA